MASIEEISRIIGPISEYQNTVASAVEEQSTTTGEMNRRVSAAARGASDITGNIGTVADAALPLSWRWVRE